MVIRKEIKVALTAICAIVVLYYGISFLKGANIFQSDRVYYVIFDDVSGLTQNNAVYANGYPVGSVHDISYDYEHPGQVCVCIEVDERMRLPKDTRAELSSSMLGSTTMKLILGQSTTYLQYGDSICGSPEAGALAQATQMLPKVEALLPKLDSILASVNTLLADPATAQTLHNTQQITANLVQTTQELNQLLANDVPRLTRKLNSVGDHVNTLTDRFAQIDYQATLNKVNSTLESTKLLLADLDQKVNSRDGSLGLMLNDRALYDNLNQTVQAADSLLTNLRQHPKRYVHFSIFGRKDK